MGRSLSTENVQVHRRCTRLVLSVGDEPASDLFTRHSNYSTPSTTPRWMHIDRRLKVAERDSVLTDFDPAAPTSPPG